MGPSNAPLAVKLSITKLHKIILDKLVFSKDIFMDKTYLLKCILGTPTFNYNQLQKYPKSGRYKKPFKNQKLDVNKSKFKSLFVLYKIELSMVIEFIFGYFFSFINQSRTGVLGISTSLPYNGIITIKLT